MQPIVTPFYLDKALWVVVLTPFLGILSKKLGITLGTEEIVGLVLPIVAYVVTHKWKTTVLQKATIENGGNAVQPKTPDEAAAVVAGVK